MFNPDIDTYFFSFWKEPRKREKTELIRKREVDRSRMKVIEYRIATRIEKLQMIYYEVVTYAMRIFRRTS